MNTSIFEFWTQCPSNTYIHPQDAQVMARVEHGFATDILPLPFFGPLKTAPVVLLFLSPGLSPGDKEHSHSASGLAWYNEQRTGTAPLPLAEDNPQAWSWWPKIVRQFNVEPMQVRDKIAILNIGAYHSKQFHDWSMLSALASSRVALGWAQSNLFPDAEAGRRLVICLRSAKHWGLKRGNSGVGELFAPHCGRNGIMYMGQMREELKRLTQQRVQRQIQTPRNVDAS